MNYCSLKDAWGNNDHISTQFKDYMRHDIPENTKNTNIPENTNINIENFTNVSEETVSEAPSRKHQNMCYIAMEHIKKCRKCYKKLKGMSNRNLLSGFEEIIDENRDVIVMILIGITLLLFINLVNNITK